MVLPVYCITRRTFSLANHIKTNPNLLKLRLFRKILSKQALSRSSHQNGYCRGCQPFDSMRQSFHA